VTSTFPQITKENSQYEFRYRGKQPLKGILYPYWIKNWTMGISYINKYEIKRMEGFKWSCSHV